jgi:hypothetical protein
VKVHGIVCSYLGDSEYDIGKTAAWLNNFVNTLFFYDLNYGDAARKYAVDYAKTFPDAKFAYHPASSPGFYADAPLFRQMAFQAGLKAWKYDDADYVVFIDASESISSDTAFDQLLPDTEWPTLFSLLLDEARLGTDAVSMGYHVFLNQGTVAEEYMSADPALGNNLITTIAELEDDIAAETDPVEKAALQASLDKSLMIQAANDSVLYWTCDPHYTSYSTGALDRMFRVGYAKTLMHDDWTDGWVRLDSFGMQRSSGQTAVSAAIVSYSYARFAEGKGPPPWNEADDGGFANRVLVQPVRNVGLTTDYATPDPAGVGSPAGTQSPAYCYLYDQFDTGDGDPDFNKYVALWRQNPRDGVWYVNYELGPIPLDPITGDPLFDPADWDSQHVSTTGPTGTGRP